MIMEIINKLLSGRLISTIIVMLVYAYCSVNGIIKPDRIDAITLIVLYAYFTKNRSDGNKPQ
jgi:hypothetical protein